MGRFLNRFTGFIIIVLGNVNDAAITNVYSVFQLMVFSYSTVWSHSVCAVILFFIF